MLIEQDAAAVLTYLNSIPSRREFHLREPNGDLVYTLSRHEAEVLAIAMTSHRSPMIAGMFNKNGLRWICLKVPAKVALQRLRRMVSRAPSTVAEDNRTIDRVMVAGGGILYQHRGNLHHIWGSGRHALRYRDGEPVKNRAVLVVPRREEGKHRGKTA